MFCNVLSQDFTRHTSPLSTFRHFQNAAHLNSYSHLRKDNIEFGNICLASLLRNHMMLYVGVHLYEKDDPNCLSEAANADTRWRVAQPVMPSTSALYLATLKGP
jgi:hypothetical protein